MENNSCTKICRFCLGTSDSNFETVEKITFINLDLFWLKLNLAVSEEPVMCKDCAKTISNFSDFKTKCLEIENCISSGKESESTKVDLREVYVSRKSVENIVEVPEDHMICRFCLELQKDDSATFLRNCIDIVQELEQYFPELYLTCTEDPVICAFCQVSLQRYFSFIKNCLLTEEKIMEYCKVEGTNGMGQIDLNSVIHFISKNSLKCKIEVGPVKIEEMCNEVSKTASNSVEMKKEEILDMELDIKEDFSPQESEVTDEDCSSSKASQPEKLYKCGTCDYETKWKRNLKRHMLTHKDDTEVVIYKCDLCDYETKRKSNLSRHSLTHKTGSEITMYKCDTCAFETIHKSYLHKHRVIHMDASEIKMHKCEMCPFETKWKRNLRKHVLSHRKTPAVVTRVIHKCDYKTKWKSHMEIHLITHKTPSGITLYKCDQCDYEVKWESLLKRHILTHKTHSEIAMYKCGTCAYETKHKDCLKRHMLTHVDVSKVEMHKCEVCPFETKWKYYLQKHVLSHRNTPDVVTRDIYKCDLCDYKTKWKSTLKRHNLIHKSPSQIIMYKCALCDYETKWKAVLKSHILTHKTNTTYK